MKFLVDANLAPGLASRVRSLGHECTHVSSILRPDARDPKIAALASKLGTALITKDADFFDLRARGVLRQTLVWLRTGNMSNRQTLQLLLPALPHIVAAIESGDSVIEIR